jgi:dienelactone hydrolase
MKKVRRVLLGFAIVVVIAMSVFVIWANTPYRATSEALAAMDSDSQVTVTQRAYIVFLPERVEPTTGFIFYPGGRVDPRAYAVPLREIAAEGNLVILLLAPFNLAILDANAAEGPMAAFPSIQSWAVGGHSLGGTAAAMFASTHDVDGLVLWASYPGNDSLRDSRVRVVSIYGTQDIGGVSAFEDRRALLPPDTEYLVIDGGNHAQFGDYGLQSGDNEATITRLDQQQQAVDATVKFLKEMEP